MSVPGNLSIPGIPGSGLRRTERPRESRNSGVGSKAGNRRRVHKTPRALPGVRGKRGNGIRTGMIPNPTGNPLGMLDFGGIWVSGTPPGFSQEFPDPDGAGEAFPVKSTFFCYFWGLFVFPGCFFSHLGTFLVCFVGKEAIPESWNPGGPWEGHSDTGLDIPKGAGRGKTLEKRREKEEKKKFFLWQRNNDPKKKQDWEGIPNPSWDPFPEEKVGKLRPDSRLKVRSGGFSSFFPAFSSSSIPSGSGTFPTSNPPKIPWKSPSSLWHRYSQNSWENSGNSLWITFPSPCKVVSYTKIHKSQQLLCSSWDLVWFSKVFSPFFAFFGMAEAALRLIFFSFFWFFYSQFF